MTTNPITIQGAWRLGWTLDVHTTASDFLGYDENGRAQFDTTRSMLGELLFQLKYRAHTKAAVEIADVVADFFKANPGAVSRIDLILPMPPSTQRAVQPVVEISRELAKTLHKPMAPDCLRKVRDTPGLKDVRDPEKRREMLDGAFEVDRTRINGKGILLIDDLYRSGATANAVTVALMSAGASLVYFLAVTRTRSNL